MKSFVMKSLMWIAVFFYGAMVAGPGWAEEKSQPVFTLDALVTALMQHNPELKAARAGLIGEREKIPQARALDDPEIGLMQWSIPSNFDWFEANETWYSLSQRLPFLGKRDKRGRIAELEARISIETLRGLERRLIAQGKQAYFDYYFAHQNLEIHHEQQALSERFALAATALFSAGKVGQQDVLRAQMEVLDLANQGESLKQFLESAAGRIYSLLNRPVEAPLGLPEAPGLPLQLPPLDALQAAAEKSRPEHRGGALNIERGDANIALAKASFQPDFMAELSYWDVHGGQNRWMTSFKMNLPWLNPKSHEAGIREAVAERHRAESAYRAAVNETRFQVQALYIAFETNFRLARLYEDGLLLLAEQAQEAALIGYSTQKNDFLTLIDAQKRLRDIALARLRAFVDLNKNLAELEGVIGMPF